MGAEGGVRLGAYRGVAGGRLGAAGVLVWLWLGVHWGRIGGVAMGVTGGLLGCGCGCGWGSPGSFWGLDGTEVLCFRR